MNIEEAKGSWNELQTKLKQKYPILTDDDLYFSEGKEQDMLRMIEYKLRITKQEMREIIAAL